MSIRPGVTIFPEALIVSRAWLEGIPASSFAILPPAIATSRTASRSCDGSTTLPPRIRRSYRFPAAEFRLELDFIGLLPGVRGAPPSASEAPMPASSSRRVSELELWKDIEILLMKVLSNRKNPRSYSNLAEQQCLL